MLPGFREDEFESIRLVAVAVRIVARVEELANVGATTDYLRRPEFREARKKGETMNDRARALHFDALLSQDPTRILKSDPAASTPADQFLTLYAQAFVFALGKHRPR